MLDVRIKNNFLKVSFFCELFLILILSLELLLFLYEI